MKTTKETILAAIKKRHAYLESQLLVYRTVNMIMQEYDGKKLTKKICEKIDEELIAYHSHYYRDGHYIRVQVNRIGQIYKDQQFAIVLHYLKHGEKFLASRLTLNTTIGNVQSELFITKAMLHPESEKQIDTFVTFLANFRKQLVDFHDVLEMTDFTLYRHFCDAAEVAMIADTREIIKETE